jgi:hypothetical protein
MRYAGDILSFSRTTRNFWWMFSRRHHLQIDTGILRKEGLQVMGSLTM